MEFTGKNGHATKMEEGQQGEGIWWWKEVWKLDGPSKRKIYF